MKTDGNSTSFLDVMACALGGMAMLFLILSVLPHSGEPMKAETIEGVESPIPLSASTNAGKVGIESPVLIRISHPYCKVDAGTDFNNSDKLSDTSWSALDSTELGMRIGILRVSPSGNTKIEFRDCQLNGSIKAEYLFHPTLAGAITPLSGNEFHYRNGKLE